MTLLIRQFGISVYVLLLVAGCDKHNGAIEFVLPNGYHGVFQIIYDEASGISPMEMNGRLVYHIPQDGLLHVKSLEPFTNWKSRTARYENGSKIPSGSEVVGNNTAFYNLSLVNDHNSIRIYFLVGSKTEADAWYNHRP